MTRDSRARFNRQISEEAAEWFIECRSSDIDIAGRRAFDAWLRRSQEHLCAYLEIAAIWNESSSLDARRELDIDALISLARSEGNLISLDGRISEATLSREDAASRAYKRFVGGFRWSEARARPLAIAASMAFVALSIATVLWLQMHGTSSYETTVGEQRSFRLADGSLVTLNSRSRIRIAFTDEDRGVELLEGQALFQVAKNPARPFVVRSGEARVQAIGTHFDVNIKQSRTIVTVLEGKVAVLPAADADNANFARPPDPHDWSLVARSPRSESGRGLYLTEPDQAVLLSAGEQLTVSAQAMPHPVRVDTAATTAWTKRLLVFESAPLPEVAEEFNRYSARKLIVEDSASSVLRLSGVFATDPDFLIRYLRERPDITVQETTTEIRIIRHD